jgi:hypothetical protein
MTPKMMRSQLAGLVKLDMGRVRRRTSRKHRSIIPLSGMVRSLRQCAWGTAKKLSSSSRSRSRLATARGQGCRHFSAQRRAAAQRLEDAKRDIAFGSQIRSYVVHPYRMVKDHRTKFEVGNADAVLDGDLDPFIKTYQASRHAVAKSG